VTQEQIDDLINKAKHHEDVHDILDDLVHDAKSKEATEINNKGVPTQIRFLVDSGLANEVNDALGY